MTPGFRAAWVKYRYEVLLPRAIAEQRRIERLQQISACLFGGGTIFALATTAAMIYVEKSFGIVIHDTWIEFAVGFPACLPAALGLLGVIAFKDNPVMELSKFGDKYYPKNP